MRKTEIDHGKAFDWGGASKDYAKYRDIYPKEFYDRLLERGLCVNGQRVLDLGTGTGVLPRGMYEYGARFTGVDAAENQIEEARRLSKEAGMEIDYQACPAEAIDFPENRFDVVTACQCYFYFDEAILLPKLSKILRPGGRLAVLYMAWLPGESAVAAASEELVLRYNPHWTGGGETRHPLEASTEQLKWFDLLEQTVFDLQVPFTRESWNGRMKACRGIGATLDEKGVSAFEQEHLALLGRIAPPAFTIPHYVAMSVLQVKKGVN